MKLLVNTLAILMAFFGCCIGLQAQDLSLTETTHTKVDVRLPLSKDFFEPVVRETPLSATTQDQPAPSSPPKTPDVYVFPDSSKRFHHYVTATIGLSLCSKPQRLQVLASGTAIHLSGARG